MGKSNIQKLQEALASGDLEGAKAIAEKLGKVKEKRPEAIPHADSSWIAPSRSPSNVSKGKEARRISMESLDHTNTFQDNGRGGIEGKYKKIDETNGRKDIHINRRPPVHQQEVRCDSCGRPSKVYPREMVPVVEEDMSTTLIYKCDRCLRRGK